MKSKDQYDNERTDKDMNPDAITGAPGSHPIGTGIGAAGAGAAGAAIGSAAGPIGTVAGAVIGAVAGGLAGKGVGEAVNPTEEDAYWRSHHNERPYAANSQYEDFEPAYRHGYTASQRYPGQRFDDVESELQRDWDKNRGNSELSWDKAKPACRDAFERVQMTGAQEVPERGQDCCSE